jgi:Tfp pilus assembly protein PilX
MENKLIEKMKGMVLIIVIAILGLGMVNTVVLLQRIQDLENKIEAIK